jgi:hypothetical protein
MKRKIFITFIVLIGVCVSLTVRSLMKKSKNIRDLEERLHNQELYIDEVYIKTNYKNVESLYMEIMDVGAQLDSMKIKYDY